MRALVIEDDPISAMLIRLALDGEQVSSEVASCGEDGIQVASLYDFDIVILDIWFPGIDGYEVVRRLRGSRVRTPILILSGRNDPLEKGKGLTNGADDFLTKPFHRAEVVA